MTEGEPLRTPHLSKRLQDTARLMGGGPSVVEIGETLSLKPNTVKLYMSQVRSALGINTRTERRIERELIARYNKSMAADEGAKTETRTPPLEFNPYPDNPEEARRESKKVLEDAGWLIF